MNTLSHFLQRDCLVAIQQAGLHPGWGLLHDSRDQHLGLVYDLMEEFRAPLIESLAVAAFHKQALSVKDFYQRQRGEHQCETVPTASGYTRLIQHYEKAVARRVKSQLYKDETASWRDIMVQQAMALAAAIVHDQPYVPYGMDY